MSQHIDHLMEHYPELSYLRSDIEKAVEEICFMYRAGGKLLLCGNGGSAADSDHISGELLKGFMSKRPMPQEDKEKFSDDMHVYTRVDEFQQGVQAIPLPQLAAVLSAFANDVSAEMVFAQLVYALHGDNDVFMGLSTSGNSKNVLLACETAKALGLKTIVMTGEGGGKLKMVADIVLNVPACETYRVQEYHLPVYHAICAEVEEELFGEI